LPLAGGTLTGPLSGTSATFSGNVGIGATPSAWSDFKVLEFANGIYLGTYTAGGQTLYLGANNYFNGTNYIYKTSAYATRYQQTSGAHQWFISTISGTAGNVASFTQAMTLNASGNLGIGVTDPDIFSRGDARIVGISASGASDNMALQLNAGASGGRGAQIYMGQGGTRHFTISSNVSETRVGTTTSTPLILTTNDTTRLTIAASTGAATFTANDSLLVLQAASVNKGIVIEYKNSAATRRGYVGYGGDSSSLFEISNNENGDISFRANSAERMRITPIGTIDIKANNNNVSGMNALITRLGSNCDNTSSYGYVLETGGVNRCFIYGNGNIVNTFNSYGPLSDIKLKENIIDATPKLDELMKVRIVNYNLIGNEVKQIGVIAQELEEIFAGLVDEHPDRDSEGNDLGTKTKSVKMSVFVPILIKAMQEQQAQIEELKAKILSLQ
jgi:hypothetical protein